MPMTSFDDCRRRLDELLEAGSRAAAEKSDSKRYKVCQDLRRFVDETDSDIEGTEELDQLAENAHRVFAREWLQDSIADIERRAMEISVIGKEVERVAATVERTAATNRLTRATAAVDALQGAITALKNFDDVLKKGDDDELRAKLTEALKSVEGLKKLVGKKEL